MQDVTHTVVRASGLPTRVSWGAALAGAVVATAIWLLLHLLAIGVGLSVLAEDAGALESIGVGTGVWSLVAPAIALFAGGLVAGRLAGIADRVSGALHGAVLWAVTALVGFVLVVYFVSRMFGGVEHLGGAAVAVATSDAPAASVEQVAQAAAPAPEEDAGRVKQIDMMGIDSAALIAHVNQKLVAVGANPVRAEQVDAIASELTGAGLTGQLTRARVIDTVVKHTGMAREHAETVAAQLEREMAGQSPLAAARKLGQKAEATETSSDAQAAAAPAAAARADGSPPLGGPVARGSDTAAPAAAPAAGAANPVAAVADEAGNAILGVALALVLGLAAAMLGASLGVSTKQRRLASSGPVAVPVAPPPTAP